MGTLYCAKTPLTDPVGPQPQKSCKMAFSPSRRALGEGERKLLPLLNAAYPESLSRVDLAAQGGYSNAKWGGFAGPLARLVELGFVGAVKNGVVRGSEMIRLVSPRFH